MKNTLLLISWIIMYSLLFSCTEKKREYSLVKKEYYSNGKIKSIGQYINDSIKHGLVKYFYPTGDLKFEIEFKNNIKHGWSKGYYLNGKIAVKSEFKNNLQNGYTYKYYSNGNLKSKLFWIMGKSYGDGFYYYPNGQIELYNCTDFVNGCLYSLRYDSLGNKIKEDGIVFSPKFVTSYRNDSAIVGKEYYAKITVAHPPGSRASIFIGDAVNDNKVKNLKEYPIKENTVVYTKIYNSPGKYKWVVIGQLQDLQSGNIFKRDTLFSKIRVIK
ncbi:MAG TPA: hypothetical protein VK750_04085 [Cytophagaceae bacterium]|jgi:antitoxin component YwqK of YwqJK toxin-antitoxin module|nr:hypothetical protein [Cytophagaceae bacterium]